MKISFQIELKTLKAINTFASTDGCRYILNGVQIIIKENSVIVAASDRRRLGAISVNTQVEGFTEEFSFIIPSLLIKAAPASKLPVFLRFDMDSVEIITPNKTTVTAKAIDGKFPSWGQVVPAWNPQPLTQLDVNMDLLAGFISAAKLLSPGNPSFHVFQHCDKESSPITVHFEKTPEFIGVIMPILSEAPANFPAWISEVKA